MKFFADLHIHSRFSRATSKELTCEQLWYWAQLKGLQVIATGDCIHPAWLAELKEKLKPAEEGFFALKEPLTRTLAKQLPGSCRHEVRFVLSTEISNIYKKNDKVRKVHNVVYLPDFKAADKLQKTIEAIGNIRSDGRPILGLDSRDLLEMVLQTDPLSFLVPAHIWTPWFSVLGSKSGFDAISDCYGDLTQHIFALETGLSSDPLMNWRLKQLDDFVLISNSDAHSPHKLAREATMFDKPFSYRGIYEALKYPEKGGLLGTVEFFPQEGKYHFDGHRACKARLTPKETKKNKGLCPVCGKPVTVGVMARVEELADRPEGERPPKARPYHNLVPLPEVIAEARGLASQTSKEVQKTYSNLLSRLGNELFILMDADLKALEAAGGDLVAEGIRRMRAGKVQIAAGYDGEYGKVKLFSETDHVQKEGQVTLF